MNKQESETKTGAYTRAELRDDYLEFLDHLVFVRETIAEENTPWEVEQCQEAIDGVIEVGERVHARIADDDCEIPMTLDDVSEQVELDSEITGVPVHRYEVVFEEKFSNGHPIALAWSKTLQELEGERKRGKVMNGQPSTEPSDWAAVD